MNLILRFLIIASLYIGIAGGLLLLVRFVLNRINSSQITVYKIWYVFIIGFIFLIIFHYTKPSISYFTSLKNIIRLPTITAFSNPFQPFELYIHEYKNIKESIALIVWASVSLMLMMVLAFKYLYFKKSINKHSKFLNNNIIKSPFVLAPLAFGIFKPKIYIPISYQKDYNQSQQKLLITHEKFHCDRLDPLLLVIYQIITYLFWFHPVIYLLNNQMKKDQERSCDELVLHKHSQHLEYSQLLYKLNQLNLKQSKSELYCSSTSMLKERIMLIKKLKPKSLINKLISKSIVITSACGFILTTSAIAYVVQTEDEFKIISPEPIENSSTEISQVQLPLKPVPHIMPTNELNPPIKPTKPTKVEPIEPIEPVEMIKVNNKIIPINQPRPSYPRKAAIAGITGFVDVEYVINTGGTVEDIKIIASQPSKIFDREAKKSVGKYKFKPIAKRTNIKQRIKFDI